MFTYTIVTIVCNKTLEMFLTLLLVDRTFHCYYSMTHCRDVDCLIDNTIDNTIRTYFVLHK